MASTTTSTSKALTKRPFDNSLMPPPPAPKRIKRPAKVLDEEDYTDALSHIIARDFFPGLLETESKQDYLNALDSQDQEWIAAAGRKLTEIMTPGPGGRRLGARRGTNVTPATALYGRGGETPKAWQGETPVSSTSTAAISTASTQSNRREIDVNMSLSTFQQKYTSEDNESFYKLLDKQNLKRAEKYSWMWAGNKIPAARQIAHRKRERLLAANRASESSKNGKELATIEARDTRKAMPDSWPSRPDNPFMFAPGSIEDTTQTVAQENEETSRAPPRAVVYDNTRIAPPKTMESQTEIPASPSLSAVQDAIAGRPRPTASEASFDGASTPRVNGYSFVDSEPEPPPPLEKPSSLLLGSADSSPNPFKLYESSKREALHHRMVDKTAKGKRTAAGIGKREGELKTPVPRFASSPWISSGGLTPAAQRLMGKIGGIGTSQWEKKTPQLSRLREGWTAKTAEKGK